MQRLILKVAFPRSTDNGAWVVFGGTLDCISHLCSRQTRLRSFKKRDPCFSREERWSSSIDFCIKFRRARVHSPDDTSPPPCMEPFKFAPFYLGSSAIVELDRIEKSKQNGRESLQTKKQHDRLQEWKLIKWISRTQKLASKSVIYGYDMYCY